jgi:branched-subunit amino acid transport protein AzlD
MTTRFPLRMDTTPWQMIFQSTARFSIVILITHYKNSHPFLYTITKNNPGIVVTLFSWHSVSAIMLVLDTIHCLAKSYVTNDSISIATIVWFVWELVNTATTTGVNEGSTA